MLLIWFVAFCFALLSFSQSQKQRVVLRSKNEHNKNTPAKTQLLNLYSTCVQFECQMLLSLSFSVHRSRVFLSSWSPAPSDVWSEAVFGGKENKRGYFKERVLNLTNLLAVSCSLWRKVDVIWAGMGVRLRFICVCVRIGVAYRRRMLVYDLAS